MTQCRAVVSSLISTPIPNSRQVVAVGADRGSREAVMTQAQDFGWRSVRGVGAELDELSPAGAPLTTRAKGAGQFALSLIRQINSLMARFNSLLGRNKFPVPMRRELGRKALSLRMDSERIAVLGGPAEQNSLYFPS
jgi:hypothetical protein